MRSDRGERNCFKKRAGRRTLSQDQEKHHDEFAQFDSKTQTGKRGPRTSKPANGSTNREGSSPRAVGQKARNVAHGGDAHAGNDEGKVQPSTRKQHPNRENNRQENARGVSSSGIGLRSEQVGRVEEQTAGDTARLRRGRIASATKWGRETTRRARRTRRTEVRRHTQARVATSSDISKQARQRRRHRTNRVCAGVAQADKERSAEQHALPDFCLARAREPPDSLPSCQISVSLARALEPPDGLPSYQSSASRARARTSRRSRRDRLHVGNRRSSASRARARTSRRSPSLPNFCLARTRADLPTVSRPAKFLSRARAREPADGLPPCQISVSRARTSRRSPSLSGLCLAHARAKLATVSRPTGFLSRARGHGSALRRKYGGLRGALQRSDVDLARKGAGTSERIRLRAALEIGQGFITATINRGAVLTAATRNNKR